MAKKVAVTHPRGFKSQFVRDVLNESPRASVKDVNEAWTRAGHDGMLGDTIIYTIKSEVGKSPIPAKKLPPDSQCFPATRIELKPDPSRKRADVDIRGLVVEELRQRIKSASMGDLIDLLNALGASPNARSVDPAANGPI